MKLGGSVQGSRLEEGNGTIGCMSRLERITTDPAICHGQPTVRGLRYPVENLLELLASGLTIEEIITDHPDLGGAARHCMRVGLHQVDESCGSETRPDPSLERRGPGASEDRLATEVHAP